MARSTEENIALLSRAILNEAQEEADQVLLEAKENAEAIRIRGLEQAEHERTKALERAKQTAERIRSQAIASARVKGPDHAAEIPRKAARPYFCGCTSAIAEHSTKKRLRSNRTQPASRWAGSNESQRG